MVFTNNVIINLEKSWGHSLRLAGAGMFANNVVYDDFTQALYSVQNNLAIGEAGSVAHALKLQTGQHVLKTGITQTNSLVSPKYAILCPGIPSEVGIWNLLVSWS